MKIILTDENLRFLQIRRKALPVSFGVGRLSRFLFSMQPQIFSDQRFPIYTKTTSRTCDNSGWPLLLVLCNSFEVPPKCAFYLARPTHQKRTVDIDAFWFTFATTFLPSGFSWMEVIFHTLSSGFLIFKKAGINTHYMRVVFCPQPIALRCHRPPVNCYRRLTHLSSSNSRG